MDKLNHNLNKISLKKIKLLILLLNKLFNNKNKNYDHLSYNLLYNKFDIY